MYHTELKALLIQRVINHSGPALSLFISFPIYQTQRFNNFANFLLLIQAETTVCSPTRSKMSSTKSNFAWEFARYTVLKHSSKLGSNNIYTGGGHNPPRYSNMLKHHPQYTDRKIIALLRTAVQNNYLQM